MFPTLLLTGLCGLVVMAALGLAHPRPTPARTRHAPHHRGVAHGKPSPQAPSAPAAGAWVRRSVLQLGAALSPLNLFGWAAGAGAAGWLATALVGAGTIPWIAAALGAATFHLAVLRPIQSVVLRFETPPAGNLDACIAQEVEAVTTFDARGQGLVRVVVDGRSEHVLATLVEGERHVGLRVRRGDRLVVRDVDGSTQRCLVARS